MPRKTQYCPRCGLAPTDHPATCPVPPEVTARLIVFKKAHGVRWKAALCEVWMQGQDWNDCEFRRARNIIGPSRLYKIELEPWSEHHVDQK